MTRWAHGWQTLAALPPSEMIPMVGMPLAFITAFLLFLGYCAVWGMPRTERMEKLSKSKMVPRVVLEFGYAFLNTPVKALLALGVSADAVTVASLAIATAGAVLIGQGRFCAGGWLIYVSFMADAVDGMIARARGTSSDRGEYFDSFVDRYADFAIFLGLMWYYREDPIPLALAAAGMIGSSVMGYARAKGEAVGIDPNVGWMQRHERAVLIGSWAVLCPMISAFVEPGVAHPRHWPMVIVLGLTAVFTNLTAVWRAHYVMSRLEKSPEPEAHGEPEHESEPERRTA